MTDILELNARDFLVMDDETLWSIPDTPIQLTFDDGVLETTGRRVIFSSYLWDIHRQYPLVPLKMSHCIGMVQFSGRLKLSIMSNIYRDWFDVYNERDEYDRDKCWRLMYRTVNRIYNDFTQRLDRYVSTMSILDFAGVIHNARVAEANQNVVATQASIDKTYDEIKAALMSEEDLRKNTIGTSVRSGINDIKQVLQCVGPRGYVTEIDSTIYKVPITVGYAQGMRKLYDSMIESRSAAKALMFTKDPLSQCEYFNRRLQLIAQVVDTVAKGDCCSQHYMSWRVDPSELHVMVGMNYVDNGEIKTVKATDQHLVGQVINLRTPFGCIHPDRQTICECCYGEIVHSIPDGASPGHVAAICIGEKISQLVLSTKHVDGSSKVDMIDLGSPYDQYLIPGSEDNTLRLHPQLKGVPIKIIVDSENAKSLPDIQSKNNLDDINIFRITEMKDITMVTQSPDDGMETTIKIPVSMGSRLGSFTRELLYHISEYGYTLDPRGDYVIDLNDWDHGKAMFELPLKHINMLDYQSAVERMILSTDKNEGLIDSNRRDKVDGIKGLLDLISSRININLGHIMVMAYSVSCVDPKNDDYRLPRGGEDFKFESIKALISNRSLGATMAYQTQETAFLNPESMVIRQRCRHPMDPLLMGGRR